MKKTYLLGSIVIGVVALLASIIALTATGVFGAEPIKLVVSSASIEDVYSGEAVTCDKWELVSGELKEGHTAIGKVIGSQTEAGETENTMELIILDENESDVSEDYDITYQLGTIKVSPRP
jgi:hypothetical protein